MLLSISHVSLFCTRIIRLVHWILTFLSSKLNCVSVFRVLYITSGIRVSLQHADNICAHTIPFSNWNVNIFKKLETLAFVLQIAMRFWTILIRTNSKRFSNEVKINLSVLIFCFYEIFFFKPEKCVHILIGWLLPYTSVSSWMCNITNKKTYLEQTELWNQLCQHIFNKRIFHCIL